MMAKRWWEFTEVDHKSSYRIKITFDSVVKGNFREALWLSDLHWDNPKCDWATLKRVLDDALEIDAPIFIIGDLFCAMQGRYDKRSNKNDLRPEHQTGDYFDALVKTAVKWFEPYKNNIVLITNGNHESSVYKNHETDLLDRLAYGLRDKGGVTHYGGYQGWVRHAYYRSTIKSACCQHDFYYHHGFGGGGPISQGMIDFSRYVLQANADVYVSGHIHRRMTSDAVVSRLDARGKVERFPRDFVRLSTFKEEGGDPDGWAVENGMGPRPLGGQWCRMSPNRGVANGKDTMQVVRQWIKTV